MCTVCVYTFVCAPVETWRGRKRRIHGEGQRTQMRVLGFINPRWMGVSAENDKIVQIQNDKEIRCCACCELENTVNQQIMCEQKIERKDNATKYCNFHHRNNGKEKWKLFSFQTYGHTKLKKFIWKNSKNDDHTCQWRTSSLDHYYYYMLQVFYSTAKKPHVHLSLTSPEMALRKKK